MNTFRNIIIVFALFLGLSYSAAAQDQTDTTTVPTQEEQPPAEETPMVNESGEQVTTPATEPSETNTSSSAGMNVQNGPGSGDVMANLSSGKMDSSIMRLPWSQEISGMRTPMAYAFIRESDVFWWKNVWRVIDCREKLNLHFKWPKNPLIQIILNAIQTGTVPVYSGMDDEFTTPVDPKDALNVAGGGTDSIYVTNPETGIQELQVITKEVNWNNVNKFRIKEVWYFDKQHSTMQVRIMGICPLWDNYTTDPLTGEDIYRGEVPIFWVYFPGMRSILVNNEAYNPFPNGIRLNWDQVFALRLFSSYIYKVDNVQDYRIKDYKSGIDILYESEAKKQELFNFEHDLWEY